METENSLEKLEVERKKMKQIQSSPHRRKPESWLLRRGSAQILNAMSRRQCPCLDSVWVICTSILVQQGLPVDHIPGTKMKNGSTFLHTLSTATSRVQGPLLSVTCPSPVIRLRCLQPWRLSGQRRKRSLTPSTIYQKPFIRAFSKVLLFFVFITKASLDYR